MEVIHWAGLKPAPSDFAGAAQAVRGVVHLRTFLRALVRAVLEGYPWEGRSDLVPLFDPSRTYTPGALVALPQKDPQKLRPDTWVTAQVEKVEEARNPVQRAFQVVTLRLEDNKTRLFAAGIRSAKPLPLRFPPEDPEDWEWLSSHFADAHWGVLAALVREAARTGAFPVLLQGDQALRKDELVPLGDAWRAHLAQQFADLIPRGVLFLSLDDLLARLRAGGWAKGVSDDVARFSLEFHLREGGYRDLGGGRWTSAEVLRAVGRKVVRWPKVPAVRSQVAQERGEDDTPDFTSYEEVELKDEEARAALEEAGEELEPKPPPPPQTLDEWRRKAPSGPIRLPPLTYQHIREAFFPLTKDLAPAFPPGDDPLLVHVTVVEGEPLPCLVSREERVIKAVDVREFADRFLSRGIPAGTYLWLERLGDYEYRVSPRRLSEERPVRCKLLSLQEDRLLVEEAEIPMRYEGDPHLFKAELRFEDLEALFQEAEERGWSIFDALWHTFPDLARLDPEGKVHWKDLFHAVFFRCRMCSPRSVLTELYTRACFVPVGGGYFRLEPERGIGRKQVGIQPGKRPGGPSREAPAGPGGTKPKAPGVTEGEKEKEKPASPPSLPPEGIWAEVAKLKGQELRTLCRGEPFRVEEINDREVVLRLHTGSVWKPSRKGIERSWNELLRRGELRQTLIGRETAKQHDAPYIAAILAAMPGVTHALKPIRLFYRPAEAPAGEEAPVATEPTGPVQEGPGEAAPPPPAPQPPAPAPPTPPPAPPRPRPTPPRPTAKSLFSEHYLEHRIQGHPEWAEDVSEPLARLQALYREKQGILPACNEAQTEEEFIQPVLEALGFAYIPQPAVKRAGRAQRPDYALFADEKAKKEAYALRHEEQAFYARAVAVADAKYWERPLSEVRRDDPRDTFKNTNPSFQIVNYLIGTGVDWGILTNGRHWRLYYRQASSTATEFYEVDLVYLLEAGDPEAFKRFWLFFRREAFLKDAQGRNFLERVREGSATYAQTVGDRLKDLVFREVFPFFAGGFAAYGAARGEDVTSEEARRAIYEATLSFLYKLLFLFYAEARGLLPVDNPGYRSKSLTSLAREIADKVDRREPLGETSTDFYDRLLNLFRLVDQGDRGLGLPRYNGGLFHFAFRGTEDRKKHAANWFLAQHKMADRFLAHGLDRLYRADGEPVDYGYLDVRHLGAIYEGLLEHRLVVDDAARGEVHLQTDKGERKATGSYYTPDYIVKYIVRHTLGPILEERAARFGELMGHIQEVRQRLADPREAGGVRALRQELERLEEQAREALLDIKVCDPAMGSGHFLVEAVDFLTDGLVDVLNRYPEHNPVLEMLARVREDIVESLAAQGIAVDPRRLDDTQLLQRVVMKRCIYGVDLNPMAVELAKVSLWLHTFTVGAPLSFLDHHLRCGNSLIGAMARDVERELAAPDSRGQLTFLTGPFAGLLRAAEIMRGISLLCDATYEEVEKSEELFRGFDEAAKPYKQLLDIYVAQHFGVRHAREFLTLYGPDAMKVGPAAVGEPYRTVMQEAQRLWREKRFFHWDLEFPEVFIDLRHATWKENPGFDAVVGNPPYIPNEQMVVDEREFFSMEYSVSSGKYDLSVCFLSRGSELLTSGCRIGMIVPTTWQDGANYLPFRRRWFVGSTFGPSLVVNLPFDVFADAYIDTAIAIFEKPARDRVHVFAYPKGARITEIALSPQDFDTISFEQIKRDPQHRLFAKGVHYTLLAKLTGPLCVCLGDITDSCQGPVESFYQYSLVPKAEGDLPYVSCDVYRYETARIEQKFIIFGRDNPLTRFYTQPRILIRRIVSRGNRLMATLETETFVVRKDLNPFIPTTPWYSLEFLLSNINSRLHSYLYVEGSAAAGRDDFRQTTLTALRLLPIRRIAFTTPAAERARLLEEGKRLAGEFTSPHPPSPLPLSESERGRGPGGRGEVSYPAFLQSPIGRWLEERLTPKHRPDPDLVRRHNADPLNQDWQLPEEGPVEQSDVVHDLLAHLAEQMIEMNKAKQAEVKGFLQWLEREMGAPLDDLTGKAKLRNYLGDYQKGEAHLLFEELLEVLRRNQRKLVVDPSGRAFQERLREEYEGSLAKLLPLKERLAATDRLIDLIVYRLYGLTEEEVAVVEGRGG